MSHPIPFIFFTGDHAQRGKQRGRGKDWPAHTSRPEVIYKEYILPFITLLQNNPIPSHLYMSFKKSVGNVLLYMRFREEQKKAHVYNTLLHALYKKERMYIALFTCALFQRAHVEVLLKISIFLNNISMHRMNLYVITCLILIYINLNHHKYI